MPESKQVIWRRLLPAVILASVVILFRAFQAFQREGTLTLENAGATLSTFLLLAIILNVVVWHLTRTKIPPGT